MKKANIVMLHLIVYLEFELIRNTHECTHSYTLKVKPQKKGSLFLMRQTLTAKLKNNESNKIRSIYYAVNIH